jgi:hypothetical protein
MRCDAMRCGVTCKNSIIALLLTYLYVPDQLTSLFRDYFTTLNEESIRDDFVIIYELLHETMDHDLRQSLDSTIPRQFVTQVHRRAIGWQTTRRVSRRLHLQTRFRGGQRGLSISRMTFSSTLLLRSLIYSWLCQWHSTAQRNQWGR